VFKENGEFHRFSTVSHRFCHRFRTVYFHGVEREKGPFANFSV